MRHGLLPHPLQKSRTRQFIQRRQRRRATERRARKRVSVKKCFALGEFPQKRRIHMLRRQHRRQRQQPPGQALRQTHDVRTHFRLQLLERKQRPQPPHAHCHLVKNRQHAELFRRRKHTLQVTLRLRDHATRPQQKRLDHHRRKRLAMRFNFALDQRRAIRPAVRRRHAPHRKQQRLERRVKQINAPRRHSPQRVAVIRRPQR